MLLFLVACFCEARARHRRRYNEEKELPSAGKSQVGPLAEFFRRIGVKNGESSDELPRLDKSAKRKIQKYMQKYTEKALKKVLKKRRNQGLRSLMDLNLYTKYGLDGIIMTHGLESKASALLPFLILKSKTKSLGDGNADRLIEALLRN